MGGARQRHYLDHASTSVLRPAAAEAISRWAAAAGGPSGAGDPGRLHEEGTAARRALEEARGQVAMLVGAPARRVVLTSGATESANTAVMSACASRPGLLVICSAVEHSCVQKASERAAGVLSWRVDGTGRLDLGHLEQLLDEQAGRVALVNCQWANHEVGTIQPVVEATALCHDRGVAVHVDAAAAAGHVRIDLGSLGADFVSFSSHKLGGPPGIGALVLGRGARLTPLLLGGSEERARRAGAENLVGAVGFGAAAAELADEAARGVEEQRTRALSEDLRMTAGALEGVSILGPQASSERLPHIVALAVDAVQSEAVLLGLDRAGIAVHSGSACASETLEPSTVLQAMGADPDRSLRVSLGWSSTKADVQAFASALPAVLSQLRSLSATQ